jgi:hypothetical protein
MELQRTGTGTQLSFIMGTAVNPLQRLPKLAHLEASLGAKSAFLGSLSGRIALHHSVQPAQTVVLERISATNSDHLGNVNPENSSGFYRATRESNYDTMGFSQWNQP